MPIQQTFSVTDNSDRANRLGQPGRHLIIAVARADHYWISQIVELINGVEIPTVAICSEERAGWDKQNVHTNNGRDYYLKFQNQIPNIDMCEQKWVSPRFISSVEYTLVIPGQVNYSSIIVAVHASVNSRTFKTY